MYKLISYIFSLFAPKYVLIFVHVRNLSRVGYQTNKG